MNSFRHMRDQLEELADRLQLHSMTVACAIHILERLNKEHRSYLQGLNPIDIAAACLYVASLLTAEGLAQRELCKAADWKITESTIRRHYRNIAEELQLQALLTISMSRRIPRREKYFCPLCGESRKNLDLWKFHLEHDHHIRGWGQSMVRARDFDMEGNLANLQILKRIREAERQRTQAKETLERIGK